MLMRRVSRKLTYPTKPRAIMALDKTTCSPVLEQGTKRRDSFEAMFVLSSKSKIISKVKWHYACWFLPFVSHPPPPRSFLSPSSYFLFSYFVICWSLYFLSVHFVKVRDLSHENLNPFIGACIESPNILLVWSYCKKGSLQVCTCLWQSLDRTIKNEELESEDSLVIKH